MERDPFEHEPGGSDVGRDFDRDFGDEPAPAFRDAPPDYLAPIDDSAPVSGHVPAPAAPYWMSSFFSRLTASSERRMLLVTFQPRLRSRLPMASCMRLPYQPLSRTMYLERQL